MSKRNNGVPRSLSTSRITTKRKVIHCKLPRMSKREKSLIFLHGSRLISSQKALFQNNVAESQQKEIFILEKESVPVQQEFTLFAIRPMLQLSSPEAIFKKILQKKADKLKFAAREDVRELTPVDTKKNPLRISMRKLSNGAVPLKINIQCLRNNRSSSMCKRPPHLQQQQQQQQPTSEPSHKKRYMNGLNLVSTSPTLGLLNKREDIEQHQKLIMKIKGFKLEREEGVELNNDALHRRPHSIDKGMVRAYTQSYKKPLPKKQERITSSPKGACKTFEKVCPAKTPTLIKHTNAASILPKKKKVVKIDQGVGTNETSSLKNSIDICGWDTDNLDFNL